METHFTQALGRSAPWRVISVDFRPGEGLITFEIDNTAKRLICPACGAADQRIHDRLPRTWRHLNFFQFTRAGRYSKWRDAANANEVDHPNLKLMISSLARWSVLPGAAAIGANSGKSVLEPGGGGAVRLE